MNIKLGQLEFTFRVEKIFQDTEGRFPQTITVYATGWEQAKEKAGEVLKTFEGNPFKMMLMIDSVKEKYNGKKS